jgi:hypothetical protein
MELSLQGYSFFEIFTNNILKLLIFLEKYPDVGNVILL